MIASGTVPLILYFVTIPLRNVVYGLVGNEIFAPLFIKQAATFIYNYEIPLLLFFGAFSGYFILLYLIYKKLSNKKAPYLFIAGEAFLVSFSCVIQVISSMMFFTPFKIFTFVLSIAIVLFSLWRIDNHIFGKTKITETVIATVKKLGYYVLTVIIPAIMIKALYFVFYEILLAEQAYGHIVWLNKIYLLITVLSTAIGWVLLAVTDLYPRMVEKILLKRKDCITQ